MKLSKNKKSIEMTLGTIGVAILVLVTVFILLYTFTNIFGKQRGQIEDQIGALGDFDNDGVSNIFDWCPCTTGDSANKGCSGEIPKDKGDYKKC